MTHFALKFGSSTRSSAKHLKEVDPVRSKIARNIFFIPLLLGYVLVLLTCWLLAVESFHRKQDCSSRPPFSLVSDPFIWLASNPPKRGIGALVCMTMAAQSARVR